MELLHTAHVPAGDGPHPTVVALHGWGASAHDLLGLASVLHGGQAMVLCPQGPVPVPVGPGLTGYGWFPITAGAPPDLDAFVAARVALEGFLVAAEKSYPIDRRKLLVLGFSQGGAMGYDLVLRDPGRFAGLAALSSWLAEPIAAALTAQPEHAHLPVLVQHGTQDPMIDVARARESRDRLLPLGVNLSYREYEGMGHEIRPEALRDLVDWVEKVVSPIALA